MNSFRLGDLILVNNHKFVICDKPAGIPVQEDKTGDKSLLSLAEIFCKTRLYPVNRIDRPVNGLVIFAKESAIAANMNEMLTDGRIEKWYLGVTRNKPQNEEGILEQWLVHDKKSNKSYLYPEQVKDSKIANLEYKIIGRSDKYYFWMIKLNTGRHHQIRAQLAHIGCPVKGDVKYGDKRSNPDKSIHLMSWKLKFHEPIHPKVLEVTAKFPEDALWNYLHENISLEWKAK
jgi:23S rRNA pseudouridine1911/1915/1917 synthase